MKRYFLAIDEVIAFELCIMFYYETIMIMLLFILCLERASWYCWSLVICYRNIMLVALVLLDLLF